MLKKVIICFFAFLPLLLLAQEKADISFPNIYFKNKSLNYTFKEESSSVSIDTLDALLFVKSTIIQHKDYLYRINGCVAKGENKELSQLRADKVFNYLVKAGVPPEIIEKYDCGLTIPKYSNKHLKKAKSKLEKEEMLSYNSRVFISVIQKIR